MGRKERSGPGIRAVRCEVEGVWPVSLRDGKHRREQNKTAGTRTRRQEDFISPHPSSEPKGYWARAWRIVRTSDVAYLRTRLGQEDRSSVIRRQSRRPCS